MMMMELSSLIGSVWWGRGYKGVCSAETVISNTVKFIRIPECVREFCQVMKTVLIHLSLRMKKRIIKFQDSFPFKFCLGLKPLSPHTTEFPLTARTLKVCCVWKKTSLRECVCWGWVPWFALIHLNLVKLRSFNIIPCEGDGVPCFTLDPDIGRCWESLGLRNIFLVPLPIYPLLKHNTSQVNGVFCVWFEVPHTTHPVLPCHLPIFLLILLTSQSHATSTSIHVTLGNLTLLGTDAPLERLLVNDSFLSFYHPFLESFIISVMWSSSATSIPFAKFSFISLLISSPFSSSLAQCPVVLLCLRQSLHSHSKPSRAPPRP